MQGSYRAATGDAGDAAGGHSYPLQQLRRSKGGIRWDAFKCSSYSLAFLACSCPFTVYVCIDFIVLFFSQFSILCFTYLGIPIAFLAPAVQVKSQFLVDLASPFILEKAKAGIQPLLRKALINDILKLFISLHTVGPVHAFHDIPCMSWGLLLGNRMEPLPRNHCVERKAPAFSTVEWLLLMRPSEPSRGEWWVLMEVQWTFINTNHNTYIFHCLFMISVGYGRTMI